MNPYQDNIDKLKNRLKKAEEISERLRAAFLESRNIYGLLMHLRTVDRYLKQTRKYNYWHYYSEQWKVFFSSKQLEMSLEGILHVEQVGYRPLESLLNKARKNLEYSNPWDVNQINIKIDRARQELVRIQKNRFFKSQERQKELTQEIEQLQLESSARIESERQTRLMLEVSRKALRNYIEQWKKVERSMRPIQKLLEQINIESPYEEAHELAYAKAAAADQMTRTLASQKKNYVEKTQLCPYCGGPLGVTPHLDHIQPVKRGGLSIKENLVWCCSKCNLAKSDKGLIEFLTKSNMDLWLVCQNLIKSGKRI